MAQRNIWSVSGEVHYYLGMIMDFSQEGKVMVNMIEYIKSIIAGFPEEIVATRMTPAADHLFTVRDESLSKPLPEEQARAFHRALAQLLSERQGETQHTARDGIPHNEGPLSRRRQLGQGEEGAWVS